MGILDGLSWLLERPQQALFQGAQRGADAYGQLNTALQNEGIPEWISNPASVAASILPMGAGALRGLLGAGDRVTGENLTQDFTGSPEWDKAIGNTLNITADPLALIPATKAAQSADQMAGTAARTWKNVQATKAVQPETIAKIDERFGNALAKYGLDLPYAPTNSVDPLVVRTAEPAGVLKNQMGYKSPGGAINEASTGFSPVDNNMIAYYKGTQEQTLPHELTHWATKTLPSGVGEAAGQVLGTFENKFPGYIGSLRANPSYKFATPAQAGEEAFARRGEDILKWPEYSNNYALNEILKRSQAQIRPEMFQDATPMALSALPYIGSQTGSIWDNVRSGQ